MSKGITLGALILCAGVLLEASCNLEKATISRSLDISIGNSSTVPFNGHLYTVTKNQSHVHVNSTDSNYKPCDIAIDPATDVTQGRLEVISTDDEIFIVGVQSKNSTDIDRYTTKTQYKYTVLRVDPRACSYRSASIPETYDKNNGYYYYPQIVRHRAGADVFFHDLKGCAPCRLNDAGLRTVESTPQISSDDSRREKRISEQYYLQYLDSMNAFFFVNDSQGFTQGDQITTFKLLDDNFGTIKERTVDFPIDAVSKQKYFRGYLGVCSKTIDHLMADATFYTDFRCFGLNANLDTTNTFVWTPTGSRSKPLSSISYELDTEGKSYISFAEDNDLRFYIVDKNGQVVKAFDMGAVDGKFQQYPKNSGGFTFSSYDYWEVNGFIVGDDYCIVIKQSPDHYSTPLQQIRCVDVKEYVKY